jgi:Siphovirus ReqiPepy6 Gp37-like protein
LEIFKFKPVGGGPVTLEQGEIVNYIDDLMWVERYRNFGEFKIKSPLSSGLREQLPIGTLISHTDSADVMMVENIKIVDKVGVDTQIEITGRSFIAYLEQRIIGWGLYWQFKDTTLTQMVPFILPSGFSWSQASDLIKEGINTVRTPTSADDRLINVSEASRILRSPAYYFNYGARNMKRGDLYKGLISILENDDLGVRVVRPGFSIDGLPGIANITRFVVHDGADKTGSVIFSWDLGDLDGADYLFSNKRSKSDALVLGRYLDQVVSTANSGLNKRELLVDGDDIDGIYTTYPTGAAKTNSLAAMTLRGNEELAANNSVEITSVNISKINRYQYREDYDIGDFVLVDANYGATRIVRVIEYVEIEDRNGQYGYPTLAIPT